MFLTVQKPQLRYNKNLLLLLKTEPPHLYLSLIRPLSISLTVQFMHAPSSLIYPQPSLPPFQLSLPPYLQRVGWFCCTFPSLESIVSSPARLSSVYRPARGPATAGSAGSRRSRHWTNRH